MSADYVVTYRGRPACPCLAQWLPVFERMAIARGIVRESIDIAQLIGNAPASAGVHAQGGAFDVWQHDPATQQLGREMGAATWNRVWPGNEHSHGVLNGCPHNAPARYQIAALADGYDGTGAGGRGARDAGPGPRRLRTWREGIAWANQQLEDDVAAADVWREDVPKRGPKAKDGDTQPAKWALAQAREAAVAAERHAARTERAVEALAKALGPRVEAAVREAMADAVVDVDVTVNGKVDG